MACVTNFWPVDSKRKGYGELLRNTLKARMVLSLLPDDWTLDRVLGAGKAILNHVV